MSSETIKILLIENNIAYSHVVTVMLDGVGANKYTLCHEEHLHSGLQRLIEEHFDVILLSVSGAEEATLADIERVAEVSPQIALIVLGGVSDEDYAIKVAQAGAEDYLVKGQGGGLLLARSIRYAIEHKKEKQRLTMLAKYDLLTGLSNRAVFHEELGKALSRSDRSGVPAALMFLDLDRFKIINDTLGHEVGDHLLKKVAQRLRACVRQGDLVSRLGGDEFTIILEGVEQTREVESVAQKVINTLAEPFFFGGNEIFIGTSIGIAIYPHHGTYVDMLIKNADTAMYHAKEHGRNNYQYYISQMSVDAILKLQMENRLHHALEKNEFLLYYQPQFSLKTREIVGAEVLLRWKCPDTETIILPKDFIPLSEETGLIVPIGEWVIREVCQQNKRWQDKGLPAIRNSVNLSARQFVHKDLAGVVEKSLNESNLNPGYIGLELTESLVMEYIQSGDATMDNLKSMGVHIAIDGFGTGFSSLSSLKRLPIGTLKIDRSFVNNVVSNEADAAITAAVIALGRSLNLDVIAEGIESEAVMEFLLEQGCHIGQGNLFSKPLPGEKFEKFLSKKPSLKIVV